MALAEAAKVIEPMLSSEEAPERKKGVEALAALGGEPPHAYAVAPALIKLLEDPDDDVKAEATKLLGMTDDGPPEALVKALCMQFKDGDAAAMEALTKLGKEGESA
eukprot:gnl/TRDRNA2_/TRDRNA2_181207_c0_seq1.p1 gnl/TRDRNA2_/TRDRNA2_181207_c0~~gnl/TRDRNA2_/TRDRNA2_181207_c0_seq1.p1  ORF type:complete len:106 (-),score=31.49 gnl/TRDRNA2_/TRDRNA2_181207_c0_seq1:76-393(-)